MERLTYKSFCGDYGSARDYDSTWDELQALRNALGKYEDLDFTADEIKAKLRLIERIRDAFRRYAIETEVIEHED